MSENTDHSRRDAFDEMFRQKLEGHRLFVDGDSWFEIAPRLKTKRKLRAKWVYLAITSAAAVALLFFLVYPYSNEHIRFVETGKEVYSSNDFPEGVNRETGVTLMEEEVQMSETANNGIDYILAEVQKTVIHPERVGEKPAMQAADDLHAVVQHIPEDNAVSEEIVPEEKVLIPVPENFDELLSEEEPVKKKNNKWLLAASFGSGGAADYGFENERPQDFQSDGSSSIIANPGTGTSNTEEQDYSSLDYAMPISFGFTVQHLIGKHWGVESGLIYTYLSSTIGYTRNDARQRLHYLGIPVNLVVYLWDRNPNWKIYLSGGGMIEKGLRSVYSINGSNERIKSSIDGFQWSLNTALGLNYRFNNGLGIYIEPRFSYYFDNDQPLSMRTKWPLSIGVSMGLNYKF